MSDTPDLPPPSPCLACGYPGPHPLRATMDDAYAVTCQVCGWQFFIWRTATPQEAEQVKQLQELPGRCPHCNARVRIEYRPRRTESDEPVPIALRCGARYEGRAECEWRFVIPEPTPQEAGQVTDQGWMSVMVQLPVGDASALLAHLREQMGFTEIDFCELQRPDRARASYGPCEPRTDSGYTIDPFPPTVGFRGPEFDEPI